ncbi:hypothetical protein JCM33374_g3114 [Metschnikowia sp. JCM 33374]|nr:hypothetical protein JCM33374_g3114 [Metschnikowia sp. JCM 33374]
MAVRQSISSVERKGIREYWRNNPTLTQQDIRVWFEKKYNQKISQSTICVSLSRKYEWLDEKGTLPGKQKNRLQKHPEFEEALYHAIQTEPQDFSTAKDIQAGAKKLWLKIYPDIDGPGFSNGWFDRFKRRYNIQLASSRIPRKKKSRHPTGTPVSSGTPLTSSDLEVIGSNVGSVEEKLKNIKAQLQNHPLSDIYSCGNTSLLWKKTPDDDVHSPGTTNQISALLCCNGDGSDKLPPLFVGYEANPRCFEAANVNIQSLRCVWKSNDSASITTDVISAWLLDFDRHVSGKGRKVVLLIDDSSVHKTAVQTLSETSPLENTVIIFSPQAPAFEMKPFSYGVFSVFKGHYYKRWLQYLLDELEENRAPLSSMSLLRAIRWGILSWNETSPATITKFWYETGLSKDEPSQIQEILPDADITSLIAQLFHKGHIRTLSSAQEFMNSESYELSDVIGDSAMKSEENTEVREETFESWPVISNKEALKYIEQLFIYEERRDKANEGILAALSTIEKDVFQRYREELRSGDVEPSLGA